MTAPPDLPPGPPPDLHDAKRPSAKGLMMVAAFRAARLSGRPALRAKLREPIAALRRTREAARGPAAAGPDAAGEPSTPLPAAAATKDEATEPQSVFAGLVGLALAERRSEAAPEPQAAIAMPQPQVQVPLATPKPAAAPLPEAALAEPAPAEPAPASAEAATAAPMAMDPVAPSEPEPAAAEPAAAVLPEPTPTPAPEPPAEATAPEPRPAYDPPLAEIGFGPGMLIRLSQLGLRTTGDLARADAAQLRTALGDISRLVDVETWISNARQSTGASS